MWNPEENRDITEDITATPSNDDATTVGKKTRVVKAKRNILARNDEAATRNRDWLAGNGVIAINMISSPGTGKTFLLEKTLELLQNEVRCAVITGDQQTDNDARRLQGKGAAVCQIETQGSCHLNAEMIEKVLTDVVHPDVQLLFIENVGNLVCPTAFDLGENFKLALLSTTEGEDKPEKYPRLFTDARTVVLTKMDLAPHLDWDVSTCRNHIERLNPGVQIIELSARTGDGMDHWIAYLKGLVIGRVASGE